MRSPVEVTTTLFHRATSFLRVRGCESSRQRWCRNVAEGDDRRGPWRSAVYDVLDQSAWDRRAPCLYIVGASDGGFRYVGISKNRLKDRWRLSPAFDESLTRKLPTNQLFHSRCWKEMEGEFLRGATGISFEVRVLFASVLPSLTKELSLVGGFGAPVPSGAEEMGYPAFVERWLRSCRSHDVDATFLPWNKA